MFLLEAVNKNVRDIDWEKLSNKDIPLKDLTKKFPDFKANILGAVRKEKFIYLKNDKMLEDDNVYVVVSSDNLMQF